VKPTVSYQPALPHAGGFAGAMTHDEPRHCVSAIRPDSHAPAAARSHVAHALRAHAFGAGLLEIVEVLVSEVVTNVIRHQSANLVEVDVDVDVDDAVTITVSGGSGSPSVAFADPSGTPQPWSEWGRGLEMLDSMASEWGTHRADRMTTLWFTVRAGAAPVLPGSAEAAAATSLRRVDSDLALSTALRAVPAEVALIGAATTAELTAPADVVAGRAAITTEQAAVGAAVKASDAARTARMARAVEATQAARAVAETAARTVDAVQRQADQLATEVADAAQLAAATVAASIEPGGDAAAARTALQVEATVLSAAAAKTEQTARAAVVVAGAVAAAAEAIAATTAQAAAAMQDKVSDVAVAMQAVTIATAQQVASDTFQRDAALALVASDEAAVSERWQHSNRLLLQAGRHDRAIALALQAAMLTRLPHSDFLQLAARYITAAEQDQVGGDWYDALVLPNGSTTLVIGDVTGHDIAAASVMGQLRNLLRALLWDRKEAPSATVSRLDRAMRDLRVDTLATMIVLSVDRSPAGQPEGTSTLRWTNAGHPAPMLMLGDGTVVILDDTTDVLLGVDPETVRRDHVCVVPEGATLLLYTDGLVETRDEGIDVGQARLRDALRTHHQLEPDALLDAVLAGLVGDQPRDDVAVLAVRFHDTRHADAHGHRS
jgi:serine phosphatase RsbU (regulator of sigma subunit)/anti-sigma regulatory factor (Ser/Thr protein kinase)